MTFVPDREELAWAAGFFDGEGNTSTQRHTKNYGRNGVGPSNVQLQISQVGRECLDRFRAAVGGLGVVQGPFRQRKATHSEFYAFRAQRFEHVQQALCYLWPFLSPPKKSQAVEKVRTYTAARQGGKSRTIGRSKRADGSCIYGCPADRMRHYGCLDCCNRRSRVRRRRNREEAARASV